MSNNSPSSSYVAPNRKYQAFSLFKHFAEHFMSVPSESHFHSKGVLTPQEFTQSGDLLISKCPTWQWCKGDDSKLKEYLPAEKQYLLTRNVPCLRRAKDMYADLDEAQEKQSIDKELEDDGWIQAGGLGSTSAEQQQIEDLDDLHQQEDDDEDDEIVDIDAYLEQDPEQQGNQNEEEASDDAPNKHIVKTRTYDISITYDKFYQTPRVWLFGYNENGEPLTPKQCLQDIHMDYSNKSVTIDTHPHLKQQWVSIHPCRHAHVMKKIVQQMAEDGKYVKVDLYLYLFLKFISSVIPTIEYDFTIMINT